MRPIVNLLCERLNGNLFPTYETMCDRVKTPAAGQRASLRPYDNTPSGAVASRVGRRSVNVQVHVPNLSTCTTSSSIISW